MDEHAVELEDKQKQMLELIRKSSGDRLNSPSFLESNSFHSPSFSASRQNSKECAQYVDFEEDEYMIGAGYASDDEQDDSPVGIQSYSLEDLEGTQELDLGDDDDAIFTMDL